MRSGLAIRWVQRPFGGCYPRIIRRPFKIVELSFSGLRTQMGGGRFRVITAGRGEGSAHATRMDPGLGYAGEVGGAGMGGHRMMPPSLCRRGRSGAAPPAACFTDRDRTAPGRLPGILAKPFTQGRHLHGDRIAGVVREEPETPASPARTVSDREKGRGHTLSRDTLSPSWAPRSSSLRRHQHFVSTRRAHGSSWSILRCSSVGDFVRSVARRRRSALAKCDQSALARRRPVSSLRHASSGSRIAADAIRLPLLDESHLRLLQFERGPDSGHAFGGEGDGDEDAFHGWGW